MDLSRLFVSPERISEAPGAWSPLTAGVSVEDGLPVASRQASSLPVETDRCRGMKKAVGRVARETRSNGARAGNIGLAVRLLRAFVFSFSVPLCERSERAK